MTSPTSDHSAKRPFDLPIDGSGSMSLIIVAIIFCALMVFSIGWNVIAGPGRQLQAPIRHRLFGVRSGRAQLGRDRSARLYYLPDGAQSEERNA